MLDQPSFLFSKIIISPGWERGQEGVGLGCDYTWENPLNFVLQTPFCGGCEDNPSALSHSGFFMAFSLHFHVILCWIEKLECVEQKASRPSIKFCCREGTNVLHSHLKRMGSAKALAGFILSSMNRLSGTIRSLSPWCVLPFSCCPHPGMGLEQLGGKDL